MQLDLDEYVLSTLSPIDHWLSGGERIFGLFPLQKEHQEVLISFNISGHVLDDDLGVYGGLWIVVLK